MPIEEFGARKQIAGQEMNVTNRGAVVAENEAFEMVISIGTQAVRLNDDKKVPTTIEEEAGGWGGGTKDGFEDRKKVLSESLCVYVCMWKDFCWKMEN